MIKVSVIVPVYNTEKYLEKCLDSLVNQTLKEIEIIIVNDGSTDNSQKIIDKYTKQFANVHGYIKENGGLSDARNYGIKQSKGEYLMFVDSDDYVDVKTMELMYNYSLNNKLDIVTCNFVKVYDNFKEFIKINTDYSKNSVKNYLLSPPMACIRMIKKSIFESIKFTMGIYYEDLELIPKLVKYTDKVGFLDEFLYYYVQRDGSIMYQKEFNNKLLDIFSVLQSNYDLLENDYHQEIEYMYITHLLRSATLRFLDYSNYKKQLIKIRTIMDEYYPKWYCNKYLNKSGFKLKVICFLAYHRMIAMLKLLKRVFKK